MVGRHRPGPGPHPVEPHLRRHGGLGRSFRDGIWALLTPVILLSGMFSGLFTPTEAVAVASTYALILGVFVCRTLKPADLVRVAIDTVETVGVVTVLVMAAGAMGRCLSLSRIPQTVAPALVASIVSPLLFLLVCSAMLLVVGCFMETPAALLILIPTLLPATHSFSIPPVQFGIMMIFNLILGTIQPPIGVVLFITSRIAGISFEIMSRAVLPWLVPLLVVLARITLWPPLTTWLPDLPMSR